MRSQTYYPIFADLHGRRCVVVGGGMVAQRKVTTLLQYGADITVVSPTATRRLRMYARQGTMRYLARQFRPADLRGAWLVYAATADHRINTLVSRCATRLRIFANVVDRTPLCSFIAPAIMKRGELVIAISTGGASPALAKQVRRTLNALIGSGYAPMLRLLKMLRGLAKRRLPSAHDRKQYFDQLVGGRVFELVRAGRPSAARREALLLLERSTLKNGS